MDPKRRRSRRQIATMAAIVAVGGLLCACAAGNVQFTSDDPAGFWFGLWHGTISVITLIVGIFDSTIEVYERNNTGGWYDFGFLLGILMFWGGGSKANPGRRRKARRDAEAWDEIGKKIEAKIQRKIRQWAEAEPEEDWDVVEAKAQAKLKRKIREWAEEEHPERLPPPDP